MTPDQSTFVPFTPERLACITLDHAQCDADHAGERFVDCETGTLAHRQRAELLGEIERLRVAVQLELRQLLRPLVRVPKGWDVGEFAEGQNREIEDGNEAIQETATRLGFSL